MICNIHPLLLLNQKEIRKAKRLFDMLDEHMARPLMSFQGGSVTQANKIFDGNAYDQFMVVSKQLNEKLMSMAEEVLGRELGLRTGMIVKIQKNEDDFFVIKIDSLRIGNATELSFSPHQWEWRAAGKKFNLGRNDQTMTAEYALNGKITIERQVLNGLWVPMVTQNDEFKRKAVNQ